MKNKNHNLYLLVMLAGIVLIVAALINKKDESREVVNEGENISEQTDMIKIDQTARVGSIEGVLNNSNDPSRGNLKLISGVGDIYVRTNRDFSDLIGLRVFIFFNGTFESFELVDIQTKIANDAFLISQ